MARSRAVLLVAALALPVPARGEGDPVAGRALFARCAACHAVIGPSGRVIVGGGRTGPNLYGLPDRRAGADRAFDYSPAMRRAGASGLTWTSRRFAAYLHNPTKFLKAWLKDDRARSRMAFRLTRNAADVYAYIRSLPR